MTMHEGDYVNPYEYDDDDDDSDCDGDELYGGPSSTAQQAPPPRFSAPLPRPGGAGGGWSTAMQQPPDQSTSTPAQQRLQEAIRSRCDRPDELLDRLDLDLNAPLKDGWTALMLAAERGHTDMVAALLRLGARADFVSADATTCLMAACGNRHCQEDTLLDIVQLLLDAGAADTLQTVAARHGTALHVAARSNFPRVISRLLAAGASADCPAGPEARTALMEAAARGNLRSTEALLAGGAGRRLRDRRGHTAAELAANAGYARAARLIDAPDGELPASIGGGEDDGEDGPGAAVDANGESAKWDELSSFFSGVGYPEAAPLFRAHDLTFVDLLTVTEATLERVGVKKVGARRRILEAVRQLHRRPWRDASLPQVTAGRPPAAADYLAILANAHKHLEVMNATLKYLTEHASAAAAEAESKVSPAAAVACGGGPTDGLRNPRVLARARNSCRLAGAECRGMLTRLDTMLVALNRLRPAVRPDLLPPTHAADGPAVDRVKIGAVVVAGITIVAATIAIITISSRR